MAKVWRQIDLLLDIPDDSLDDARPAIREYVKTAFERNGGVTPNNFVDNLDQAADHIAQDDNMALAALITMAIDQGLRLHAPRISRADILGRPLPTDYRPPS